MIGGYGSRDFEKAHEIFASVQRIPLAIANVMQRGFGWQTQGRPYTIAYESVQTGAFVNFIGMRKGTTMVKHFPVIAAENGGAVHVVEKSLHKVRRRREIL